LNRFIIMINPEQTTFANRELFAVSLRESKKRHAIMLKRSLR
jgi:hypothetical protein